MLVRNVFRQMLVAVGALASIVVVAEHVRPVYASRAPVVQRLTAATWRDSVMARAPYLHATPLEAIRSEQFARDRQAFAEDLLRTGLVTPARADSLSWVAVREAYARRVPPALVLGVMLTENDELKSTARSNVGAIGLMQVHRKVWVPTLGRLFGTDLRDDETNLQYGVYILSHVIRRGDDSLGMDGSWRRALLRYNGCVRGTNTKNCHTYPDVVQRRVERFARASCDRQSFTSCVAQPVWLSLRDDLTARPRTRLLN